jgi:hypothetical protein
MAAPCLVWLPVRNGTSPTIQPCNVRFVATLHPRGLERPETKLRRCHVLYLYMSPATYVLEQAQCKS